MVRKIMAIFVIILITTLAGCSSQVTESYLIGGSWYGTKENIDGEFVEGASCIGYFTKGLAFKEDGIVYNEEREVDYEYELEEIDGESGIIFTLDDGYRHYYHIKKVDENEIELSGIFYDIERCYLERKE